MKQKISRQLAHHFARAQVHNLIDMKDLQKSHSSLSFSSSSSSLSNSHTFDIGAEEWNAAEKGACEILSLILPNVVSECRRKEIIEYIQILIGRSYGIKVFPFGSVPLKTYLPDGDIDLTAVSHHDEELLLSSFCSILENEEVMNTEIHVRNVQCIPAQVKVVKCSMENISVDISFNQMAGLCALSFLEQVDQLIGKNHLFKRSVILIKAWCFYESRILGAHSGLISTYALETLIVHIINLFHSTLCSPLAVLYKFLAYYSKFDWENYCVAINGVMLISSLPEAVVQPPEGSDDSLFSAEFLQNCKEAYSVSTGINQIGQHQFHAKFLNIMDPLSNSNNLGRSVNKANFSRIKYALSYASEKLGAIFALPLDKITEGIETFYKTTLEWNGKGKRPDVFSVRELGNERSEASESSNENQSLLAGIQYGLWSHDYGMYQCNSDPLSPQNTSRVANLATNGEKVKSRGTGTYIPKPVHVAQWISERSWRRADSPPYSQPMPADVEPPSDDSNEFLSAEDGSNSFEDLSLMEFPPLPGAKPAENNNVNPTNWFLTSRETTESSLESVESGTTQTSKQLDWDWEPPSPVIQTLPCLDSLPMDDSPSSDPPLPIKEGKEKEETPENDMKRTLMAKPPPVLEDMNEFPDLPCLRLRDPNELPDLPLLRLRDLNDFPDLSLLRLRDPNNFPPLPKKSEEGAGHKGRNKADKRA